MTEHANEVIADDNAGTLLAIESTNQLKARYVTAAEWVQMGQHGIDTFQKRLLPLAFGMLMYEGDPAVMRRTLSNVPPGGAPPDADHRSARLQSPRSSGLRHRVSAQDPTALGFSGAQAPRFT